MLLFLNCFQLTQMLILGTSVSWSEHSSGSQGAWSLSQAAQDTVQGISRMRCQSIIEYILAHIMGNLAVPISLTVRGRRTEPHTDRWEGGIKAQRYEGTALSAALRQFCWAPILQQCLLRIAEGRLAYLVDVTKGYQHSEGERLSLVCDKTKVTCTNRSTRCWKHTARKASLVNIMINTYK